MPVNIKALRDKYAAARGHMRLNNAAFLDEVEAEDEKAKHPADKRRLHNKVQAHLKKLLAENTGNSFDRDMDQVTDGWFALLDILEAEIGAIADGDRHSGVARALAGNAWHDPDTGNPVTVLASTDQLTAQGGRGGDAPAATVGQLIRNYLVGAKGGAEGARGATPAHIRAALSEGTDGAGGYTIPLTVLSPFIDRLRAKTTFIKAGAQTVILDGMKTRLVRLASDATAGWRAENAAIVESQPTFEAVDFRPYMVHALVKVSYELLQDTVNADAALEAALIGALSVELDRAAYFGTGPANNMPLGLDSQIPAANIMPLGPNGGLITPDSMIDAQYMLDVANADMATAAVMHPRTMRDMRKAKDGQGNYMADPFAAYAVDGLRAPKRLMSTSFPINQTQGTLNTASTLHLGDFTKAMLGIRQQLTILRLDQTFMQNMQIGFLAFMRADVQVQHPESFTKIVGIKSAT